MADNIVLAKYKADVKDALKSIDQLDKKVEKLDKDTKKSSKDMQSSFTSAFTKIGAAAGIAFSTQQLIEFGKESVKVAAQMQGVERAFSRIGGANSANLLQGLRDATRGTVSDLQLMQKAVQASNFKIPLESLARLFKFAQARARETGESVEYLTNSIVLGIGRKSPLILDNLGISAVELRARLKGVGVEAANVGDIAEIIGDIAEEELAKMGDQADTTSDKIEKLAASTENLKAALGSLIAESSEPVLDFFTKLSTAIANDITEFSRFKESLKGESGLSLLNKLTEETAKLTELETEATEKAGRVRDAEFNKIKERVDFQRRLVDAIKEELDARVSNSYEQEITVDLINKETEAYRRLLEEQNKSIVTITSLEAQLKELQNQLKNAEVGGSEFFSIIDKITAKTKELNEAIAMTKLADALKVDVEEDFDITGAVIDYPKEVQRSTDIADKLWDKHFENLMREQDEAFEHEKRIAQARENLAYATVNSVNSIVGSIAQIQSNLIQEELQQLDILLEQGQLSREEYDQRRRELLREQAESQKAAAIFQATVDGAVAVISAFKDGGPILAALVGAAVAAQVAAIASQPLPQFAEGGWVTNDGKLVGRSHAQGGIRLEAEGGEYIVNKIQSKKHADLIESINAGRVEDYIAKKYIIPTVQQIDGQMAGMAASAALNGFNDMNLLRAIDRHRMSDKEGFKYLANQLSKNLKPRKRGNYA